MMKAFITTCCLVTIILITYFSVSPYQNCKRTIPSYKDYKDAHFEALIAREDFYTARQLSLLYSAQKRILETEHEYVKRTVASCMRTTSW